MEDGWIKLYRKLIEWHHYKNGNTFRLFLHLLMTANIEDKQWKDGVVIKRGQVVTSIAKLAYELGLTDNQIRTSKNTLKNTGEITIKTTNKFSIITVCKFDDYQAKEQKRPQAKPQAKPQATTQSTSQQLKNNKEEKNIKISTNVDTKRSFVAPEFENVFSVWLEYKHQRRESYKSDLSLKTCYNKLYKLADGDPQKAMAIVEQSMANNWAGLFPLKNQINGNNRTSDWQQTNGAGREQRAAAYMSAVARLAAEDDARAAKVRQP
jgi:hypothetical protein